MLIIFAMLIVISLGLPTLYVIHDIRKPSELMLRMEHDLDRLITGDSVQPFSLSAYFDRIEMVHVKLLQEREQNPVSKVIELWWGLDGIRLLEDGTTEWVRKGAAQISQKKPAPRDRECESEYRRWYQMANANNIMLIHATAILDKYRKLDMQNARAEILFCGYIDLKEAIGLFKKIRYLDEQREAEELLERCDRTISNRKWEVEMNMRQAMLPPPDYIANPSILDYTGGLYGMNGIENAIQAQANQYFPQQFCQQPCNLESQINQSIAQQTQATESDIRALQFQITQQERTESIMPSLAEYRRPYKGVPVFIDELCNCCATKSSKK